MVAQVSNLFNPKLQIAYGTLVDIFRMFTLSKDGGYWFDIGMSPFNVTQGASAPLQLFNYKHSNISLKCMGAVPDHPLIRQTFNTMKENAWAGGSTGPSILQMHVAYHYDVVFQNGKSAPKDVGGWFDGKCGVAQYRDIN
jgi:hypothetical protein